MITKKNHINQLVKRLYEVRSLKNDLEKEDELLKTEISAYMQENEMEMFETAKCAVKFRHVRELKFDKTLGLDENDLVKIALKCGWLDSLKVNKPAYHKHSKEVNNGESVFIENDRLDLIFTFKKIK